MIDPNCSILVVDDARFSSAMVGRTLERSGFKNIRYATSALQALDALEKDSADILIADWLMPEMDGLELTDKVRQLDEASSHFTYILLLTAREGTGALEEAFDRQVDDFIHKSSMNEELPSRVFAAQRMSSLQNKLLKQNQLLLENNQQLRNRNLIDALTGLGNSRYMLKRLTQNLKAVKERNQACSFILISLETPEQISTKYNNKVLEEVICGIARRLSQLVRPLDIVARLQSTQFAILTSQPSLHQSSAGSFKRIHDGLNLKAFKTSGGFITIKASTLLCGIDHRKGSINAEEMLSWLQQPSSKPVDTTRIHECDYPPKTAD